MKPHKRLVRRLGWVALLFGMLGTVFVWLVGSALLAPAPTPVVLPESFRNTDVSFLSASGSTLHGNFIPGTKGTGVVILMHGVRGNRGGMARHAEWLRAHGFAVLLFDFQAHGESPGKKITSGYLESKDATAAVEFVRNRLPGEKVAVLGSSLGGAAAVLAEPPLPVDAMILEMVYPDIQRAVKNRIAMVLGNWARPFSPLLTGQLKYRIGISADWFSPVRAIAKISCPKLILGGSVDRHTTFADTQALFEAASEPKELWIIPGAKHQDLYAVVPGEYEKRILNFLKSHISVAPSAGKLRP